MFKIVVVPQAIDAVGKLILQDRHVREIEISIGINGTSIYSILYENCTAKKNLFTLNPTQFVNHSKNCDWSREMAK